MSDISDLSFALCGSKTVKKNHDSFARNSPMSTVLPVECFLEVIFSICRFEMVNFLFEKGVVESKTCKQYGRQNLIQV